jgi:hypothetical protein
MILSIDGLKLSFYDKMIPISYKAMNLVSGDKDEY